MPSVRLQIVDALDTNKVSSEVYLYAVMFSFTASNVTVYAVKAIMEWIYRSLSATREPLVNFAVFYERFSLRSTNGIINFDPVDGLMLMLRKCCVCISRIYLHNSLSLSCYIIMLRNVRIFARRYILRRLGAFPTTWKSFVHFLRKLHVFT